MLMLTYIVHLPGTAERFDHAWAVPVVPNNRHRQVAKQGYVTDVHGNNV